MSCFVVVEEPKMMEFNESTETNRLTGNAEHWEDELENKRTQTRGWNPEESGRTNR